MNRTRAIAALTVAAVLGAGTSVASADEGWNVKRGVNLGDCSGEWVCVFQYFDWNANGRGWMAYATHPGVYEMRGVYERDTGSAYNRSHNDAVLYEGHGATGVHRCVRAGGNWSDLNFRLRSIRVLDGGVRC